MTRTHDEAVTGRRDRIRWGAIWAGLVVAVATYLLLQLALVATGLVELGGDETGDALLSAGAAVVAFLLGGVTAGASALWRDADDGLLHGIIMWAVGLVALVVLAAAGSGLALGSFDTTDAFDRFTAEGAEQAEANEDAEEAAAKALLGVGAALAASAVGGMVGAKMWPRRTTVEVPAGRVVR